MAVVALFNIDEKGNVMADVDDYDEKDDNDVDDSRSEETKQDTEERLRKEADVAEAESLTVTAKQQKRASLEDEIAAFLAKGGKITEVPADESAND